MSGYGGRPLRLRVLTLKAPTEADVNEAFPHQAGACALLFDLDAAVTVTLGDGRAVEPGTWSRVPIFTPAAPEDRAVSAPVSPVIYVLPRILIVCVLSDSGRLPT